MLVSSNCFFVIPATAKPGFFLHASVFALFFPNPRKVFSNIPLDRQWSFNFGTMAKRSITKSGNNNYSSNKANVKYSKLTKLLMKIAKYNPWITKHVYRELNQMYLIKEIERITHISVWAKEQTKQNIWTRTGETTLRAVKLPKTKTRERDWNTST